MLDDTPGLLALLTELERWERAAFGDPLAAHHGGELSRYLEGLRDLAGGRARAAGVLLAALALGPRGGALPGAGDLGPLLRAAIETDSDVVDLAIAWGCGWGRLVATGHEWHGRWVAALLALSCLVVSSISRAVRWLEDRVPAVGLVLSEQGVRERSEWLSSHARHLAMELSLDACSCGRDGGAAGPGRGCGRPDHRLASWRPDECRLQAFLATAVRGSPRRDLQGGAFAVSMLAHLLREDEVVRVGVAEFHVCHVCNPEVVRAAVRGDRIDLGQVTRGLHEFPRCPVCHTLALPRSTYRVGRKSWLLVPDPWGGEYVAVERHRCACCRNLFASGLEACPLCRHPVPGRHRLTALWARRVGIEPRSARGEARGT